MECVLLRANRKNLEYLPFINSFVQVYVGHHGLQEPGWFLNKG